MNCDYTTIRERERSKTAFLDEKLSLRIFDSLEDLISSIKSFLDASTVTVDNEWNKDSLRTMFVSVDKDTYKIRFYRCKDQRDRTVLMIVDVKCLKG